MTWSYINTTDMYNRHLPDALSAASWNCLSSSNNKDLPFSSKWMTKFLAASVVGMSGYGKGEWWDSKRSWRRRRSNGAAKQIVLGLIRTCDNWRNDPQYRNERNNLFDIVVSTIPSLLTSGSWLLEGQGLRVKAISSTDCQRGYWEISIHYRTKAFQRLILNQFQNVYS